jgi:hypothetical protein
MAEKEIDSRAAAPPQAMGDMDFHKSEPKSPPIKTLA